MWKKARTILFTALLITALAVVTDWILDVFRASTSVRWAWIDLPSMPISLAIIFVGILLIGAIWRKAFLGWITFATLFTLALTTNQLPPKPVWVAIIFVGACIANRPFCFSFRLPKEFRILCWPRFAHPREWMSRLKKLQFPILKDWTRMVRLGWWRRRVREFALLVAGTVLVITHRVEYERRGVIAQYQKALDDALTYKPPVSTRVYDYTGQEEICRFTLEDREYISIKEIPVRVQNAFIAAEDGSYWTHDGVDLVGIARAGIHNISTDDDTTQGGSTITQQVVKQRVLKDNERSLWRKMREVYLASELERRATKEQILEIYLNYVYLGGRTYGIKTAAKVYYGKNVKDLTIGEAAFLAGMPKAPSEFSLSTNSARAEERQIYVLRRMREQGFITKDEESEARKESAVVITNQSPLNRTSAPYFCEHLRKQIEREYGTDAVNSRGLVIYTTIDMKMQRPAEAAVQDGLIRLENSMGFTGPEKYDESFTGACKYDGRAVEDGSYESAQVVSNTGDKILICARGNVFPMYSDDVTRIQKWQDDTTLKLKTGHNVTVQIVTVEEPVDKKESRQVRYAIMAHRTEGSENPNVLQSCLQGVEPTTGFLRFMVGGYDFNKNQFNTCTQARRQAGSSIKPTVYTAYIESKDGTVTDIFNDHPISVPTASGTKNFKNYKDKYRGPVTLYTAMKESLNSVSVQLLLKVGVDEVIRTARALGYNSPIERVVPIAVGAVEVTPYEHVYAYATLASGGREMPHQCYHSGQQDCDENAGIFITKVQNAADGTIIYEYVPKAPKQAIPAAVAYAVISLMEGVTQKGGTGQRAAELGWPVAGKTGTTNENKDTWFLGCTPVLCAVNWTGRQKPITISDKATGGNTALPIWLAAMKKIYKTVYQNTPPREFPPPNDIVLIRESDGQLIPYRRGTVPAKHLSNRISYPAQRSSEF